MAALLPILALVFWVLWIVAEAAGGFGKAWLARAFLALCLACVIFHQLGVSLD